MLLDGVKIEYLAWNGFSSVMVNFFLFLLALWAARDQCETEYYFQRIGLSIIRRHSKKVWPWFSSVSTWVHHVGRQRVFIKWLAYNFTVTQKWTVDGFCRLFFRVKAHQFICTYVLDQTKVRKINVMRRGSGKFKVMFPLLNKRISLWFLFDWILTTLSLLFLPLSSGFTPLGAVHMVMRWPGQAG